MPTTANRSGHEFAPAFGAAQVPDIAGMVELMDDVFRIDRHSADWVFRQHLAHLRLPLIMVIVRALHQIIPVRQHNPVCHHVKVSGLLTLGT